jgi:hypothetical protein
MGAVKDTCWSLSSGATIHQTIGQLMVFVEEHWPEVNGKHRFQMLDGAHGDNKAGACLIVASTT